MAAAREPSAASIARARIANQAIGGRRRLGVAGIVERLGALQAQDYLGALWALGVRLGSGTESMIEEAIAERAIIRTWPMRGTLHFVPAADARWMLELLTPRVIARNARRYRELELDVTLFARARVVVERALSGGRRLTRSALYARLHDAGIATTGARGLHILGFLAQQREICFGPREGKQPSFALFDEWIADARSLTREESLAELARRYFSSHGPATLHDFIWWSGLSVAEARTALAMNDEHLRNELVGDTMHWRPRRARAAGPASLEAHLLPPFDELIVAYRRRDAVVDPRFGRELGAGGVMWPTILVGERIVGTWRRVLGKRSVAVYLRPFAPLLGRQRAAVERAATRYGDFLEMAVELHW
jgi:Winged helix DNA-binding domain